MISQIIEILIKFLQVKDELSVYQDKLVLCGSRVVIPESLQSRVVKIAHEGHLGIVKTKQLIRDRVWFPGMDKMVENEIKQCSACQLVNSGGYRQEPLIIIFGCMKMFITNIMTKFFIKAF